jgi:uncharacterized membrane protein HdeD (DUF308 family)
MPPVVLFPEVNQLQRLGLALMLLGVLCAFSPFIAREAVVSVVGGILLVGGSALLIHSYWRVGVSGKSVTLILGLIATVFALLILAYAWSHRGNLTLVLVLYFVTDGIWKILASIRFRASSGWVWLCSGALSLLLGMLVWQRWPISGLRAIGTLTGINVVSTGGTLVLLAQSLKGAIGDVLASARDIKR